MNKGTVTPSSRRRLCRHHRHLLCRRLRLPLRLLPRLALVEGGHRQLPTDQKGLSRGILDVFCPCPMVRLASLGKRRHSQMPRREERRLRPPLHLSLRPSNSQLIARLPAGVQPIAV